MAPDQSFGADDGIRTRDPNLGKETQVVCSVRPRPLSRYGASTTSTPSVELEAVRSSPFNALSGDEGDPRSHRAAPRHLRHARPDQPRGPHPAATDDRRSRYDEVQREIIRTLEVLH